MKVTTLWIPGLVVCFDSPQVARPGPRYRADPRGYGRYSLYRKCACKVATGFDRKLRIANNSDNAPSKWIAYEEAREDFGVVAIFDDELWRRWSPQDSEIREYAICEERLAASLISDEPPMWEPDFLRAILKSYGRGGGG